MAALAAIGHYVRVSTHGLIWRPAPGWPDCPPGWVPPDGWSPPADWPAAPPDWEFWAAPPPAAPVAPVVPAELTRSGLVLETRLVIIAGLSPWVASAVVILIAHLATGNSLTQLPSFTPHQPALNVVLAILAYLPTAAVMPLTLLLLLRTGQRPASLGLTRLGWNDFWAGVGIAAAAFGCELVLAIALSPLDHSRLMNSASRLHVPVYYLIIALSMSLTTAVAEEVIVNGYLLTRLEQLGWSPAKSFWLSLALRTSYHLYYGVAVVFTVPFGWLVTRSFQKHRKLCRPILAHFLFDSTAFTIAILTAAHH
jgi:membrane protease YdiL (CAAX protease family)